MKKIDKQKFEQFKLTLPAEIREERFSWLGISFDIAKAIFVIKESKLETWEIDVKKWSAAFGLDGKRHTPKADGSFTFNIFNGVSDKDIDNEKINHEIPIIIAEHVWESHKTLKNEISTLVIDGNKRLRKSFLDGKEKIKAYYLPKELVKLIRV